MNFDDVSPELQTQKSENNAFIIESLENSIKMQQTSLTELEKNEVRSDDIERSIKETKKIIKINSNLLEEIQIIDNRKFSLSPIFTVLSADKEDIKAYHTYNARYLTDFKKATERLGKNKKYKFHHPEHIALALQVLGYDQTKTEKILGILCLFFTKVSIRTHASYIRYILGYFAGIYTLDCRIAAITKFEKEGFPADADSEKLIEYKHNMINELDSQKQSIFDELDSTISQLNL